MTNKRSNKKRADLLAWFRTEASALAESYEAALRMLDDKDFPDRILLISHLVREICNSLPEILDPTSKRDRIEYDKILNEILPNWSTIPSLGSEKITGELEETVPINRKVALQIDSLVQAHQNSKQYPTKPEMLFRILVRNQPSEADVNMGIVKDFNEMQRKFVKWSKIRSHIATPVTEEELQQQFRKFEDCLYSLSGNFFVGVERLDELLQAGVKPSNVDEIISLIASPHHEAYFFNKLDNPNLIQPLKGKGMFDRPFKTEHLKGGGIRYTIWPPSRFLSRMAKLAPDEVVAIFCVMKTDNASVVRDITNAALSVPIEAARRLVPIICQAAERDLLSLCFEDVVDLCVKLAEGGQIKSGELLAHAVFKPRLETNSRNQSNEHQYRESLERVVPVLAMRAESTKFLEKLCDWLRLIIENRDSYNSETGNDGSHLWRPAIEDHMANQNYHLAGTMVAFVRDGFEQAIKMERIALEKFINILDKQKHLVFSRIKLHLINKFAKRCPDLVQNAIMDHDLFEKHEYKHEYALLVEQHFPLLTEAEQNRWFSWIDKGPSPADLNSLCDSAIEKQKAAQKRYWKYGKLHWVRMHLKDSRKEVYDNLRLKFGELDLPDLNFSYSSGMWRSESPIKPEDLSKLGFKEAVKLVSEWRPDKSSAFTEASIEGLASSFEEYLATQPGMFSALAMDLVGCPAIYIRKFIAQMAREVRAERPVNIDPVLELCTWVLSRPFEECTTPKQDGSGFLDPDWRWTRDEIALLIRNICQRRDENTVTCCLHEFRVRLWSLIDSLSAMPEDTLVKPRIGEIDARSQDYVEMGINSSRGKVMEAALSYAHWIFAYHKSSGSPLEGFEAIPGVKQLIESRMASSNRTPGELALIGSNINLIYAIDKNWLETNANTIFPISATLELPSKAVEWAAWNAFLVWIQPHIELYRIFRKQFAYAASHCSSLKPLTNSGPNPVYRLGEHLVTLYIRGGILLEEEGVSLRAFLSESMSEIRQHTIEFVGRLLDRHEAISPEIETHCRKLWETYWLDIGAVDAQKIPSIWPLENWFSSGKFSVEWLMEQLEKYLSIVEMPDIGNPVVEELANANSIHISKITSIIDKIIQSDKEGWRIAGWQNPVYNILEKAMKADENTSQQAQKIISYLGRCGYMRFGELLP